MCVRVCEMGGGGGGVNQSSSDDVWNFRNGHLPRRWPVGIRQILFCAVEICLL